MRETQQPAAPRSFDFASVPSLQHCYSSLLFSSINRSNESSCASQKASYRASHAAASRSRSGRIRYHLTLPRFSPTTSSAASKARRCFTTAGIEIPVGAASSLTDASPRQSRSKSPRRVASASAPNVLPTSPTRYLTIWLSISQIPSKVNPQTANTSKAKVVQL